MQLSLVPLVKISVYVATGISLFFYCHVFDMDKNDRLVRLKQNLIKFFQKITIFLFIVFTASITSYRVYLWHCAD